ncbi:MAG: universal stress protein [Desulfobacterales bacterium]|jgi:nucleotide-binding universal stress UspA family protein|nr:universal stress protein [Desulfobacterales bacterium]
MKRFKNILYLNEPTVDQESAIARAVSLAANNQANLTIVDVIPSQVVTAGIGLPPEGPISDELRAAVESDHRKAMESMVQSFKERLQIRLEVLVGKTYLEAIRAVLKNGYDLLIKPAENPTWTNRLFGSDDLHLLRKCPCPVWLMKPPEKHNYSRILAAVDFNPLNPTALEQALNTEIVELAGSLALTDSAFLHLVHAWEAFAERAMLSRGDISHDGIEAHVEKQYSLHQKGLYQLGDALRDRIGPEAYDRISPRFQLLKGPAKKVIANLAAELQADIVVMGTVARTGISGLIIGNTAEAILDQLSCSVLAIKPPGFKTPVKFDE